MADLIELFETLESDTNAAIRLLHADDPLAVGLRSRLDAEQDVIPVALIEPIRTGFFEQADGTYDIRLAVATKMGLSLAGSPGLRTAAGWTFGPCEGAWELVDSTGKLVASGETSAEDSVREPTWTGQAMAAGWVLVTYGAAVGVRAPDGVPAWAYDDRFRAAELFTSLMKQKACVAIVRFSR